MGGEIQDILISDLIEGTYYARLRIRREGELIEVDCRPSDAIAVAVTVGAPIYVNESVLWSAVTLSSPYVSAATAGINGVSTGRVQTH